ncbi:BREX-1 system adenine-specific DNA-methyltransferase PglX [Algoriphagus limi]|uniref:site-specific DNA-methyltransferase (adenine-specific) n=1 Tax=Algoriphagus limi TaxID=2975273 RepID=A0ABT2G0V1_9BACT|nr:BREX-1 system adenine-specific DNA-methyltransferase PglX [Algoriphagus limi]MCS5488897.1 BREX-1 system adenine-specific DNA-methyltransferase PglX [Algoriphagus limi]
MSLSQGARNKIKSFVQAAKKLLMSEFETQLQQFYGIRPNGTCLLVEELTAREASVIETARLLRQRLHYLESTIAGDNKAPEAVRQLIREQAFTILNRFAALRMSEERNIIRESIRNSYNSEGFLVYDQLTGGAKTADQFTRYKWYIGHVFDELAIDLPAVFDRFSPYALLFPSERVLLDLLLIINDEELNIYREAGHQPINLWREDETIGWIYQYYNSREEISEMRVASDAPRNSRELAVRNQFFTPRYVVQFLVDNSLGRQWYEMTKGQTALKDLCQYMVKQSLEIFLEKGEAIPETKIDGAHYVEFRALKDPREILFLDPACGSMHFGLYGFDLFEQIYIEAWDHHPALLRDLRDQYLREDFIREIPGFILRYNIHGVDIDPRAIQIAGLSLWLRAQKSFDALNIQPADRPSISKSNLVIAEPLPGDKQLLSDFSKSLPGPIGKLVRIIWDKMQLAGETGLLLKIEEELKKEIEIARQEYEQYKNSTTQASLFGSKEENRAAEMAAIYGKGQKISKDFFDTAEEEVLKALKSFAENAEGEDAFQKLLFAEDTARGFAFIELCRKRYDVIVMNPPFGAASENSKVYIEINYPLSKYDLASVFIDRMLQMLDKKGDLGSITTRTIFFLGSFTAWRSKELLTNNHIRYFADLGGGVLDAMVEVSAYIIGKGYSKNLSSFFRATKESKKDHYLNKIIKDQLKDYYLVNTESFKSISNEPICYWIDNKTLEFFKKSQRFENEVRGARLALKTADNYRYVRNSWEIDEKNIALERNSTFLGNNWSYFLMSDSSSRYFSSNDTVVFFKNDGFELKHNFNSAGQLKSRPMDTYGVFYRSGLSWSFRTAKFQPHIIPFGNIATSGRCIAVFPDLKESKVTVSLWNSEYIDYCLKLSMEWIERPKFINGTVNQLPYPELPLVLQQRLSEMTESQYARVKSCFDIDDKSLAFVNNEMFKMTSITKFSDIRIENLKNNKEAYLNDLSNLNNWVYDYFGITQEEREDIKSIISKAGNDNEGKVFDQTKEEIIHSIFSILVGCVYGRWDVRLLKNWKQEWSDEDLFKARKHSPFLFGPRESTLDLVLPQYQERIKEIWNTPYPIEVLDEVASVSDINPLTYKLKEVIRYFWPETFETIEDELIEHFKVNDLAEIFDKHNKFFDAHLRDYTRNKRVSPIYWHMGVPSGRFTIWVYYPKLNEGSLFKIVNELVDPKIKEIAKEVDVLQFNGSAKELNDQKEFLAELVNFKEELLRVAQLPYKPNQDDGVLINAAPLHNLFRHSKWKKDTEACWKKLQKGEYDWAHLAYSIWPDRVREKCKKDLSMAIAHGLEDICEVKSKEKKEKKSKEIKEEKQTRFL